MESLLVGFLIFSMASCHLRVAHGQSTFNVLEYGAVGDGQTDDSPAFMKVWEAFCGASEGTPTIVVPDGHTFLLNQLISFKGPCQSNQLHVQILGTLLAPHKDAWGEGSIWLQFRDVTALTVEGSGKIDGQGQTWWTTLNSPQDSAHVNEDDACEVPVALVFEHCDGLQLSGLTHVNGPGIHVYVGHSQNVEISHLTISAPGNSPNTDGIDAGNSAGVNIHNCIIGTGDDCIAVKGGSQFVNISQVTCGPGHGISIGSLGRNGEEEIVENVMVENCHFIGATSGARIKTWPGGKGHAKAIWYEHIIVERTRDPILIDQHYLGSGEQAQAVKVSDVTFNDIRGTSIDDRGIVLDCAEIACTDITFNQISISSIDPSKPASAICNHAYGTASQDNSPSLSNCLNH